MCTWAAPKAAARPLVRASGARVGLGLEQRSSLFARVLDREPLHPQIGHRATALEQASHGLGWDESA